MRLKINHTTEYSYSEPVQYSLQRLRLTPLTQGAQRVVEWETVVEGATVEVSYDDNFGNRVHLVSVNGDQTSILIHARGVVDTVDKAGIFGAHTDYAPLWLYLRDTPLTKPAKIIRDLSKMATGTNELSRMHALMETVHATVEYRPGETGTLTTAEQALEARSGVCQDHAHIMVSAARHLGLPARYVSGYLMMDATTQQTASHAWAEVHLAGLGWVGFDAANKLCPDDHYVRLACGLDYRDAAPISGMVHGLANETLSVSVTVEEQGQSQSQG